MAGSGALQEYDAHSAGRQHAVAGGRSAGPQAMLHLSSKNCHDALIAKDETTTAPEDTG